MQTEATGLPGFEESSPSCVISNLQQDLNQRTNHRQSFILNDDYYFEDNYKQEVKGLRIIIISEVAVLSLLLLGRVMVNCYKINIPVLQKTDIFECTIIKLMQQP